MESLRNNSEYLKKIEDIRNLNISIFEKKKLRMQIRNIYREEKKKSLQEILKEIPNENLINYILKGKFI